MSIRISEKHGVNPSLMMCFYCLKESSGLALLGALPGDKEAPRNMVYDFTPCNDCEKMLEAGVVFISVKDGAMDGVNADHSDYQRTVDHLPSHKRNKARPFIPNPHRTGGWIVVRRDAVERMVQPELAAKIIRCGFTFVEDKDWDELGLPRMDNLTPAQLVAEWTNQYYTNMAVLDLVTCGKEVTNEAIEYIKFRDYPSLEEFADACSDGIVYFQSDGGYTRCAMGSTSGTLRLIETTESVDRKPAWDSPKAKSARIALELIAKTTMEEWEKNPNLFNSELDATAATGDDGEDTSSHTSCSEKNDDDRDTDNG